MGFMIQFFKSSNHQDLKYDSRKNYVSYRCRFKIFIYLNQYGLFCYRKIITFNFFKCSSKLLFHVKWDFFNWYLIDKLLIDNHSESWEVNLKILEDQTQDTSFDDLKIYVYYWWFRHLKCHSLEWLASKFFCSVTYPPLKELQMLFSSLEIPNEG